MRENHYFGYLTSHNQITKNSSVDLRPFCEGGTTSFDDIVIWLAYAFLILRSGADSLGWKRDGESVTLDCMESAGHQVLNRARWSPLTVSRQLLLLIVETFVPAEASVDLVIDETLERRWGANMSKRGHYRDSALSSRERAVSSPGLRGTRHGSGGEPCLDEAKMGLAFHVCARHHTASE